MIRSFQTDFVLLVSGLFIKHKRYDFLREAYFIAELRIQNFFTPGDILFLNQQ
jgi:hypothetical protein